MKKLNLFVFIAILAVLSGCSGGSKKATWNINDQEYLETQGFNVLAFHDYYPEGDQGGIEFIHHGERTASNGFIQIMMDRGSKAPGPEKAKRLVDREKMQITSTVNIPELNLNYDIRVWPVGKT